MFRNASEKESTRIIELALSYIQKTLCELQHKEYTDRKIQSEIPPTVMCVTLKSSPEDVGHNTGKPKRRWMVGCTEMEEIPLSRKSLDKQIQGMYYNYGDAEFSFFENGSILRIGWYVGPRFGRGYDIPVKEDGTLGEPQLLWKS